MTITHVQLLSLPVTDQDRAKSFYVDTLGLKLLSDNHMGPGQRWVQVVPSGGDTSITLVTWFDTMPAGSLRGLVLETDDLDGELEMLTGRGVTVDGGIQTAPWGRYITIEDPDGNGIVIQTTESRG